MIYCVFRDAAGLWRWHLLSPANRIIAASAEGYSDQAACRASILQVKASAGADIHEF